jgi:hypothetical protein
MDWSEKIARSPDLRSKLVEASHDERSEWWGRRTARGSDSGSWRGAEIMQDGSTELNNRLATSCVYL